MSENANTFAYSRAIDRAATVRLYERGVQEKVSELLDDHIDETQDILNNSKIKRRSITPIVKDIEALHLKSFGKINTTTERSLFELLSDQVSYQVQTVEASIGRIWRTQRPQRRLGEDIILNRPLYSDKTLLEGWSGVSVGERKRLELLIRRGLDEGLSLQEIALKLRKGNIHKITREQSKSLVTTAITSVSTQGDFEVYKANSKALKGWEYVAILDIKTSNICRDRDGRIYGLNEQRYLPPAHFRCRSTTIPVFNSWDDMAKLEGVAEVRRRNLKDLTPKQTQYYDGQPAIKESYDTWLRKQSEIIKLKHLGDQASVDLFNENTIPIKQFTNASGNTLGIKQLRALTSEKFTPQNDTRKFASAKEKLAALHLGASRPDDFINNPELAKRLKEYYLLQAGELDGNLSLTNYRGILLSSKSNTKRRVLNSPPTEAQLLFNPITSRYEDARIYQPAPSVFTNAIKLVDESKELLDRDKIFIKGISDSLADKMGVNQRTVVVNNLRTLFARQRQNKDVWANFKAVAQAQIKFDIMNVSESLESRLRADSDILKRLLRQDYLDPVLGPIQLEELKDSFIDNILAKNKWEDSTAPKIARELRNVFDYKIPLKIRARLSDSDLQQFYLRFANRLSLNDGPDRDQFAVALGRDLYNLANLNGDKNAWYDLGKSLLESKNVEKFFVLDTFGVQKRRMKSRMSNAYFGPYYDTISFNIRVTDPRIQEYSRLTRKVELGLRIPVVDERNRLIFRKGFKTYFVDRGILGLEDTRIPITSTTSFSDFPEALVDGDLVDALNWTAKAKYKIDPDFYDFTRKLLYFKDDKGLAEHYDNLNEFKHYIGARGDAYERFKAMEWLRAKDAAFSNHPFVDHRVRIYDRGLISPQAGETFRPFLNTAKSKPLGVEGFGSFRDQVGSFLGGLDDFFEGRHNSLTVSGRKKIYEKWKNELVTLGNHMIRAKPEDIRAVLNSDIAARIEGEELAKFYRFAIEAAKIDNFLKYGDETKGAIKGVPKVIGNFYTQENLAKLNNYKTSLALEQDASSSGAQIIALTTKNRRLAELSNVVPTSQKQRLYDEIAGETFRDPEFIKLNERLNLTEKDLRKASKAQNMVECCHIQTP